MEALRRKATSNSLAINMMSLPLSHREMLTTLENLDDASMTTESFLSVSDSLLPHIRKLRANLATHHILRISAASFLKKYHSALAEAVSQRDDVDDEEVALHRRRQISDMKLAFDLVDFRNSEVSESMKKVLRFSKMDYARMSRDGERMRSAFDEIYSVHNAPTPTMPKDESTESKDSAVSDSASAEGSADSESAEGTGSKLLEHDLMALYSHSPYLGEWATFLKIGDALKAQYGRLEPVNRSETVSAFGHDDGVSFGDLYEIGKAPDIEIDSDLPVPMDSSLKFEVKPIDSMQIRFKALRDGNAQSSLWFGGGGSVQNTGWIEVVDADSADSERLALCRMGAVQKALSISQSVPRVQGPIFHDHRMRMRGSAVFMAPTPRRSGSSPMDSVIPKEVELNGVNDFVQIRQIEEWDLKPVEKGNIQQLVGTVTVRREPVHESMDSDCKPFEIEYECKVKLSGQSTDYY